MHKPQTVIFGEVLFDCFPDGKRVLGGAPFNVAWHCQAFGMKPLLISRVGNDTPGEEIQQAMADWGMTTAGLQLDLQHPSGVVDVQFVEGEPVYSIVENSAWDFIDKPVCRNFSRIVCFIMVRWPCVTPNLPPHWTILNNRQAHRFLLISIYDRPGGNCHRFGKCLVMHAGLS